ncbi:MAG TPA: hypothetical protein VHN80_20685 [Kineosporiaceae bacterium]|nr:hypothetical protein [Kineosporiaceae bacterium]
MERLGQAALDDVLNSLLGEEPLARVVAIGENGLFVSMPDCVPLRGHVVLSNASSALDLVIPEDIVVVIETWEAARTLGTAKAGVHPLVAPEMRVELHFVDATHCFGVYLGFVIGVPDTTAANAASAENALRPRYGVMRKNDVAVVTACDESVLHILGLTAAELVGGGPWSSSTPTTTSGRSPTGWICLAVRGRLDACGYDTAVRTASGPGSRSPITTC